jgi:hypothetical protein
MRVLATIRRAPLPRQFRLNGLGAVIDGPAPPPRIPDPIRYLPTPPVGPTYPVGSGSIPAGSYQLSSRNITVDGNGNLNAQCQTVSGSWVQSPPLYYLDCTGDISNQNGVLTCTHSGIIAAPAPVPLPPVYPSNSINPATGLPYAPIPNTGPLPPGAGYQQVEAPGNPYPYVYIGQGGAPAGSQYAIGQVPPGSYQQTSSNISVDQNGYLYATCLNEANQWVPSPPLYYLNCVGDISNQNGVLTCGGTSSVAASPYGYASPYPYGYPTYPSTAALNVPMPGGGVLNATAPAASSPGFGSQIGSFFSQYGLYLALGLGGFFVIKALSGGRR